MASWGQTPTHKLPEPQMTTESASCCLPPPVGLPIDIGVPGLIAAGLGIGIYFLRPKKRA